MSDIHVIFYNDCAIYTGFCPHTYYPCHLTKHCESQDTSQAQRGLEDAQRNLLFINKVERSDMTLANLGSTTLHKRYPDYSVKCCICTIAERIHEVRVVAQRTKLVTQGLHGECDHHTNKKWVSVCYTKYIHDTYIVHADIHTWDCLTSKLKHLQTERAVTS